MTRQLNICCTDLFFFSQLFITCIVVIFLVCNVIYDDDSDIYDITRTYESQQSNICPLSTEKLLYNSYSSS